MLFRSGHPLDSIKEKLNKLPLTIDKLSPDWDQKEVSLLGLLTQTRRIRTKTNKEMLTGQLEDLRGSVSVVVFQNEKFDQILPQFLEDGIVSVSGRIRVSNDNLSINCSQVSLVDEATLRRQLMIDASQVDRNALLEVMKVTEKHRGTLPMYFRVGDVTILSGKKFWVKDDPICIAQIESILGKGRVWLN